MNSSNLISIIGANFAQKDFSCCNKSLDEIHPYSAEAWAGKRLLGVLPSGTKSWFCTFFLFFLVFALSFTPPAVSPAPGMFEPPGHPDRLS